MDRDMAQLKAARVVFPKIPRMLCVWHIEKNVLVHSSQYIKNGEEQEKFMKNWVNLINSPTIPVYNTRWEGFEAKYQPQYSLLLSYLMNTWLGTWKVLVFRAWVNQHLHFGNWATSQVEGAHSMLKSYLQVSTGDLKVVYNKITLLLKNRFTEFEAAVNSNKIRIPDTAQDLFYAPLVGQISSYALGKLWDERHCLSSADPLPSCTESFWHTMGMPCAHNIQDRLIEQGTLQLDDIHHHWYLAAPLPRVMEPLVLELARGNPRRKAQLPKAQGRRENRALRTRTAASSTRQDPSEFEVVLRSQQQLRKRKN